jgi:sodium transport system permease protein
MTLSVAFTVWRKEMLEMLRDRRTLISMVIVPILAVPVLMVVGMFIASSGQRQAAQDAVQVAMAPGTAVPGLRETLYRAGFKVVDEIGLRDAVEKKRVAAGIESVQSGDRPVIRLYVDASRQSSILSGERLRVALESFKSERVKQALAGSGVPEAILSPFSVERVDIAPKGKLAQTLIGGMIGYIVILLMFSGAMYPAIDMTAGEKERRTLEVLLCSPAGRNEIVLGKILAASAAAFLTGVLNVGSLVLTFRSGFFPAAARTALGAVRVDPMAIALILLIVAPTAVTAAAVMISISLFAKSFKEGQSYLTPLMMLVIFPAMFGVIPGVDAKPFMTALPVFNVSLLIRSIFNGEYTAASFAIAFGSNLVYASVAFWMAVRIFRREDVLFRS